MVASAPSRVDLDFVPGGLAVDAAGTALLLWTTFDFVTATTRALALPRGGAAEPFELASAASAGFDHITARRLPPRGTAGSSSGKATDRGGQVGDRLFVRRFAR